MRRVSKYGSRKAFCGGNVFDSRKEARRYSQLQLLQSAGEISDLQTQVHYVLQEGFRKDGKWHRPIVYIADFVYTQDGQTVVEDAKGYRTDIYRIKRKLFERRYPDLTIREV